MRYLEVSVVCGGPSSVVQGFAVSLIPLHRKQWRSLFEKLIDWLEQETIISSGLSEIPLALVMNTGDTGACRREDLREQLRGAIILGPEFKTWHTKGTQYIAQLVPLFGKDGGE